ncbi:MAG: prepilin-type N-terminal cleavage/methylation domain-containing protein [Lysobacteraceae bacterium]|jgi:general secretion pathway protein I|nr:prepilin-type N-terminal cleavage/methylation domain-containing protein [Xanthomonadaceae bacterium]MCZ8319142.1 prepilin-type N-terminal cleavage/methylation domain-containing protein [Silanimonas sp.]
MTGHSRQTGFSLLEAIVAMTMFAMGAVALYALQAQSVRSLQRVAERQAYVAAVDAALPLVEDLNPMREPSGTRRVADLEVRWTSTPLEDPRPGRTAVGLESLFEVGLYAVDVEVRRNGEPRARFNLRRVGYRQVRRAEEP